MRLANSRFVLLFVISLVAITAQAQTLSVTLIDQQANPIEGAVIELLVPDDLKQRFLPSEDVVIDQIDKEFVPRVSTVVAGRQVSFPNSDDILHHVYSFSPISTFNIPLYGKDEQAEFNREFPLSGVAEIGCNIHDWMLAYIYVSETSLSRVTNTNGMASLSGFPAGSYQLRLWHPRLDDTNNSRIVDVDLSTGDIASLEFSLVLKRERQIRRAPSSAKRRYR